MSRATSCTSALISSARTRRPVFTGTSYEARKARKSARDVANLRRSLTAYEEATRAAGVALKIVNRDHGASPERRAENERWFDVAIRVRDDATEQLAAAILTSAGRKRDADPADDSVPTSIGFAIVDGRLLVTMVPPESSSPVVAIANLADGVNFDR